MTDVYRRREAMKNLAEGIVRKEDLDVLTERREEQYGEITEMQKKDAEGMKVTVGPLGDQRFYWIPRDKAWIGGGQITIEQAYRIFEESEDIMKVREIRDASELESVTKGMRQEIRRILGNRE